MSAGLRGELHGGPSQLLLALHHTVIDPIARYSSIIPILRTPLHSTPPLWGSPSEYCQRTFGVGKLEWCDYPTVKKIEDMFIRFDRIHERDRQTNEQTQTSHDGIGRDSRLCIAPRGKNSTYNFLEPINLQPTITISAITALFSNVWSFSFRQNFFLQPKISHSA